MWVTYPVALVGGLGAGLLASFFLDRLHFRHLTGPNPDPNEGPSLSTKQVRMYRGAVVALITGLFVFAAWWRGGLSMHLVRDWLMIFSLVPVMASDWICYRINDGLVMLGVMAAVLSGSFLPWIGFTSALLGAIGYAAAMGFLYLVSIPIYKRPGLADGDIVFGFSVGAFLGWGPQLVLGLSVAVALGGLVEALLLIYLRLRGRSRAHAPMGTYMAAGTMLVVLMFL